MTATTTDRPNLGFDLDAVAAALADSDCGAPVPTDLDDDASPGSAWGQSVFDAIDTAFTAMADGDDPIGIDCGPWADLGLPDRFVSLRELRDWLGRHRSAYPARAAVWQHLVARARQDREWITAAAGMALPALVAVAGRISRGYTGDPADIDAEILTAFLGALRTIDLDDPRLFSQMRWIAVRAGMAMRWDSAPLILLGDIENAVGMAPHRPYGHPDLVVARAVAAQIIDADDAELILATRLEGATIEALAAAVGVEAPVLRMRRKRAETALAEAVTGGLLSGGLSSDLCRHLAAKAAARQARRTPHTT